jgi:hypothetical protein
MDFSLPLGSITPIGSVKIRSLDYTVPGFLFVGWLNYTAWICQNSQSRLTCVILCLKVSHLGPFDSIQESGSFKFAGSGRTLGSHSFHVSI